MLSDRRLAQDALNGLGAELATQLTFDDSGVITLEFADEVTCSIEQPANSDRIFFSAAVFRMPSADRERLLAEALALNLFHLSLPDSALALDRESDEIVLRYSAQCETLAAGGLAESLVAITAEVQRLRTNLHHSADPAPARPAHEIYFGNAIRV